MAAGRARRGETETELSAEASSQAAPRRAETAGGPGFRHEALFYSGGDHGFVCAIAPLVRDSLDADAAVMVAVVPPRRDALREALGASERRVRFLDMVALGRNPACIIPIWREFVPARAAWAPPALGIGEPVWPGRTPAELDECERHESLLNLAFDAGPAWQLVCPYDVDGLEHDALAAARRTHPLVTEHACTHQSDRYKAEGTHGRSAFMGALPAPGGDVREVPFGIEDLPALRRALTRWARDHALAAEDSDDLVLAVDELATNSVRHGGGQGTVRVWQEGSRLLCEVRDAGQLREPLVGRLRPGDEACCGRGMWLVNQLCDLVQIRSQPGCGSVIRVHKTLR
jgi:anti-sigma regulatory factor (Ser/Thr protein kinase)